MSRTIRGLVGTLSATQYSAVLTGSGTDWDSTLEGCLIRIGKNGKWYVINRVDSATSLELTKRYQEPTCSGEYFEIGDKALFQNHRIIEEPEVKKSSNPNDAGLFPDFDQNF
jgi:hypothetical protein